MKEVVCVPTDWSVYYLHRKYAETTIYVKAEKPDAETRRKREKKIPVGRSSIIIDMTNGRSSRSRGSNGRGRLYGIYIEHST